MTYTATGQGQGSVMDTEKLQERADGFCMSDEHAFATVR